MEYNGDIAQVMSRGRRSRLRGAARGQHPQLRLPVHSGRRAAARQRPPVHQLHPGRQGITARKSIKTIRYPTPNAAALALMPADYRDNHAIFPPPAVMAKCEYAEFEGMARAHLYGRDRHPDLRGMKSGLPGMDEETWRRARGRLRRGRPRRQWHGCFLLFLLAPGHHLGVQLRRQRLADHDRTSTAPSPTMPTR